MKKGYLGLDLLILFVYFSIHCQVAMANHGRCPFPPCHRPRCAPDHYAPSHRRPCLPCSRCGPGLYVAHACAQHRDTVCDSCHTYRGPHNRDFYDRCIRRRGGADENMSPSETAKETESMVAMDVARGLPTSVIIACSLVIGALAVTVLVTSFVVINRRYCKKVDQKCHYVAVATKEAVML